MTKVISKSAALALVLIAQAALFGLLTWLAYASALGEGTVVATADAPRGFGEELIAIAATLALTTIAMLALVLRLYRRQTATNESEQAGGSLIEQSIDGVVIHRDGEVLYANNTMAHILDLGRGAELAGQSLFGYIPQFLDHESQECWCNLGSNEQPHNRIRWKATTAQARLIHIDILSQPVDWQGAPAIRSTVSDVTDQVALAERERQHTAVLSAVSDAHSIYLDEAREKTFFNQLLVKILHISSCEHGVIAQNVNDSNNRASIRILAISDPAWQQAAGLGEDVSTASATKFPDLETFLDELALTGSVTIVNQDDSAPAPAGASNGNAAAVTNVMVLPLKLEDDVLGAIILANRKGGFTRELAEDLSPIVQAITRIVVDYKLTRLREAAEQASKLKSVFLAHMNHELRTPLSGVIANLELLHGTTLSAEQRELVSASMSAGKGLLSVIGNTLDLTKIEADELTLDPIEFDLIKMLESVRSIYLAAAQEKHITLSAAVCSSAPRLVIADEMRLRQILSNLVSNSIKFTAGGRICLSLKAERVDERRACLHFAVDDTGIADPAWE